MNSQYRTPLHPDSHLLEHNVHFLSSMGIPANTFSKKPMLT